MVHRHVEIALNLRRVQIQRQCPAGSRRLQQVRHQLRGNRYSRLVLAVLPRVAVIRQHRGNSPRRSPLEGVDHQQQLQQMVIYRVTTRLHHENIRAADIFQYLKINLAVAETPQQRRTDRHIQVAANTFGQRHMCRARKYLEAVVIHEARAPTILLLSGGLPFVGFCKGWARAGDFCKRSTLKSLMDTADAAAQRTTHALFTARRYLSREIVSQTKVKSCGNPTAARRAIVGLGKTPNTAEPPPANEASAAPF